MSQFRKLSGPTWVNRMLSRRLATVAAGVVLAVPAVLAGSGPATAASGSAPELVFTPSSYDYGQVAVGHAPPAAHDFTLTNRGTASSGPLTLTLSAPGSAAFAITNNRCDKIILRPGKSYTFTVQFVPTNSTAYIAGLTATSKRPGVTATLRLTGTGMVAGHLYWTNPRLNVAGAGTVVEAGLDG